MEKGRQPAAQCERGEHLGNSDDDGCAATEKLISFAPRSFFRWFIQDNVQTDDDDGWFFRKLMRAAGGVEGRGFCIKYKYIKIQVFGCGCGWGGRMEAPRLDFTTSEGFFFISKESGDDGRSVDYAWDWVARSRMCRRKDEILCRHSLTSSSSSLWWWP